MRRQTFGSDLTMSLSRIALPRPLPPEVEASRTLNQLEAACSDVGCLVNDLFSFRKEVEFEGEIHNAALVAQRFLEVDAARALAVTRDLCASRARQFEHLVAAELPVLYADLGLDPKAREAVAAHVRRMKEWMAGVLRWHQAVDRYREPELRRTAPVEKRLAGALAGLGTSAARIVALRT
jgi:germacradienol/geosmin synthase